MSVYRNRADEERALLVLNTFADSGELVHVDKKLFLFNLYKVWRRLGRNRSAGGLKESGSQRGITSTYQRLYYGTRSREEYKKFLTWFLNEWEENGDTVLPYPHLNGEASIEALVQAIFEQDASRSSISRRISMLGLELQDIELLKEARIALRRPIQLQEIYSILTNGYY